MQASKVVLRVLSRESQHRPTTSLSTQTQTITEELIQEQSSTTSIATTQQQSQQLVLHLRPQTSSALSTPASGANLERRVTFTPETINNEHLGRLKSNCCCIYVPPRIWDDPSTWTPDEAETEHCRGHTLPPPPSSEKKPENDNNDDVNKNGHGSGCC